VRKMEMVEEERRVSRSSSPVRRWCLYIYEIFCGKLQSKSK
jgi:hypothetical protein